MKEAMKKTSIGLRAATAMLALTVLLGGSFVDAQDWTNSAGDNDWNNASNWDTGVVPSGSESAFIDLAGADRAIIPAAGAPSIARLRPGGSDPGEVDILGDIEVTSGSNNSIRLGDGGALGTINHQDGHVQALNDKVAISRGSDAIYNLTGGTLDAESISMGSEWIPATGELNITGGSLYAHNGILFTGDPDTVMRVHGSNVDAVVSGRLSDGTTGSGGWRQDMDDRHTSQTLEIGIDAGGVTPIEIASGDVIFSHTDTGNPGDPLLDVSFLDGSDRAGTWTVMTWQENVIGADDLAFADTVDTDLWSFDIDTNNNNLSVTAIPEPSSLLLLGLAGLLLMKRRRV